MFTYICCPYLYQSKLLNVLNILFINHRLCRPLSVVHLCPYLNVHLHLLSICSHICSYICCPSYDNVNSLTSVHPTYICSYICCPSYDNVHITYICSYINMILFLLNFICFSHHLHLFIHHMIMLIHLHLFTSLKSLSYLNSLTSVHTSVVHLCPYLNSHICSHTSVVHIYIYLSLFTTFYLSVHILSWAIWISFFFYPSLFIS